MKLEFTPKGRFVSETEKLVDDLEADAVVLLVFGSRTRGSGCCCEMRVKDTTQVSYAMIDTLRDLADSMETAIETGQLEQADDNDQHKQTLN